MWFKYYTIYRELGDDDAGRDSGVGVVTRC